MIAYNGTYVIIDQLSDWCHNFGYTTTLHPIFEILLGDMIVLFNRALAMRTLHVPVIRPSLSHGGVVEFFDIVSFVLSV